MARFLGVDYGTKKVGLALSDESVQLAFPHKILATTPRIVAEIKRICEENQISKIVLGQSLDYKGRPNPIMEEIEKFKLDLEKELKLPVVFENEILTTRQASHMPRGHDKPRTRASTVRGKLDASAAALILQSYIDKQKNKLI